MSGITWDKTTGFAGLDDNPMSERANEVVKALQKDITCLNAVNYARGYAICRSDYNEPKPLLDLTENMLKAWCEAYGYRLVVKNDIQFYDWGTYTEYRVVFNEDFYKVSPKVMEECRLEKSLRVWDYLIYGSCALLVLGLLGAYLIGGVRFSL